MRILVALASLISSYAYAEVYSYTGTNFTNVTGVLHTTDMRVTGGIVTSSPIPPNSNNFDINGIVTSWSFNDGVQTINSSNGVTYPLDQLIVSTDGLGDISEISIEAYVAPRGTAIGDTDDFIWVSKFGVDLADIGAVCTDLTNGICSSWPFMENAHNAQATEKGMWVTSPGFPDLGFQINPGLNDAWYNPATNGQGFLITVFPDIQQVFLAWFTYDIERPPEDVTAMLGEPGHRWLTAQGLYSGDTANLTIYVTEGGVFDAADPPAQNDGIGDGTMTIEFADCTEGLVTYEMTSPSVSGEIPIQRITNDNVVLCETLANQ
jgi:hypothetical protein